MPDARRVYRFWFGEKLEPRGAWFGKDPEFDRAIRAEFADWMDDPRVEEWNDDSQGLLARIILWDQFPRNAFRETPRSFAYDPRALAVTRRALAARTHLGLHPCEATFLYLPLEHSEVLADQDECVRLFTDLRARVGPDLRDFAEQTLNYAIRHREIIARFGRFPHRNAVLGRTSTVEETVFLREPGSRF